MPEHRHLPHLRPFASQPVVFLTVVTADRRPGLAGAAAFEALTSLWRSAPDVDGWYVGDFILMPDHVHLLAQAARDARPLARWVGSWKSLSARRLQSSAGLAPPLWQRDYFDRFLRSTEDHARKWDYVARNPVRQGLCAAPEDWPWRGRLFDLRA